jgi:hypothetical protein
VELVIAVMVLERHASGFVVIVEHLEESGKLKADRIPWPLISGLRPLLRTTAGDRVGGA